MRTVRVNVKTKVNNAAIRREKREGREKIIVPSATLPDDVVMNRILYPSSVIEQGYKTLEGTLAPLGHPMVGNKYISAKDPEALAGFYFGAHNENVRRENGRVFLDKVIDVQRATESEKGRSLLEAINKGDPIHTSTGLFVSLRDDKTDDYDSVAEEFYADHDAILLNEQGAATPAQGVGLMVNADGSTKDIDAMDVDLDDEAMKHIADSIADHIGWQVEREEREQKFKALTDKILSMLKSAFGKTTANNTAAGLNVNHDEDTQMSEVKKEDFDALAAQVKALATNAEKDVIGNTIKEAVEAAVKPITDRLEQMETNAAAAEKAERDGLVEKIVKANMLEQSETEGMSINALRKLAEKVAPSSAAPMIGAFAANADEDKEFDGYFDSLKEKANG